MYVKCTVSAEDLRLHFIALVALPVKTFCRQINLFPKDNIVTCETTGLPCVIIFRQARNTNGS